ncbi:short chain aldehyde dehydrogenase 1 [Euphorbia lathyris]|uniref:Short chain aldehyde dehydrogenase 1 n=1 Tax=Euphorbia lathyris TaxID=212925 RepID=ADH1_EUPLT|nr:RecName: Full=Short chain aldehyde dehydrogenase 1; Short=ElADH1; AltName: Full=Jolkinol C synthase [Euphorbia lathyris]AMY98415.1 short chain aldehyde dehydrogenase 1 [Euphorbia lathyris]
MNGCCSQDPTSKRLEGKVAVITGGASGIGACTVKLFVKHGAKVVIADVQDELGHSLCKEIGSEDVVTYVHCDVSSDSDVKNVVDSAVSKYGKLDIMFSNAGVSGGLDPRILATENDEFKKVFEVNVFGGFLAAKHAARVMIPEKKGCILFTSSNSAAIAIPGPHSYVVSKHALNGLMKNLSAELGQHGIRVNCVSPFGVVTPMMATAFGMKDADPEVVKATIEGLLASAANLKEVTLGAEDIANAALYLASDEAKYVSGLNLVVDGGYSVTNPSFTATLQKAFAVAHV